MPEETLYDESQIRTINVVDRSYGLLELRVAIISLAIRVSLEIARDIIVVTAVLYNLSSC